MDNLVHKENKKTIIDKDYLEKAYCIDCKSIKEIVSELQPHVTFDIVVINIKDYNLVRSPEAKKFATKKQLEKSRKTLKERYGITNPGQSEEFRDKAKKTTLERYGTEYYSSSKEGKDRRKTTIQQKYGVESIFQSPSVIEKIKETKTQKYGINYNSNSEILLRERETNLQKYGVPYYCMSSDCRYAGNNDSGPNKIFSEILNNYNIAYEREFRLDLKSYDFKVGDILIEIDPSASHNSTYPYRNGDPLQKTYHINKSILAEQHQYKCIHIFDWDDLELVVKTILLPKRKLYARKCEIRQVEPSDATEFLKNNHLQGSCLNQTVRLGLYYQDQLVQLMTFGKPRYNKNYEYELLRLCSKSGYIIIGGAQKLFKHFLRLYNPKSIISYCDRSKFLGSIYEQLNFKVISDRVISKHWYNSQKDIHITDNLLRQRGFDQLLGSKFGCYGKGTSNEELMLKHKFVEIYDAGQSTYVWESTFEEMVEIHDESTVPQLHELLDEIA